MKKHDYLKLIFSKAGKQTSLVRFEEKHLPNLLDAKAAIIGSKLYEGSTDRRNRYREAVGLDIQAGEGVDYVLDICNPNQIPQKLWFSFDHIDCLSVLEHVEDPFMAAATISNLSCVGGTILLSVPFCWRYHGYPGDYWRFTIQAVEKLFPSVNWDQLCYMARGVKVDRIPHLDTKFGTFYMKTEVYGFGRFV